jgi:transcriptional regulator with XRE-family HTH domain
MENMAIAEYFRVLRAEQKIRPTELSRRLGIDYTTVWKHENGKIKGLPDGGLLTTWLIALNGDLKDIEELKQKENPTKEDGARLAKERLRKRKNQDLSVAETGAVDQIIYETTPEEFDRLLEQIKQHRRNPKLADHLRSLLVGLNVRGDVGGDPQAS